MSDDLTLEKLNISERLHSLEKTIINFEGTMKRISDSVKRNAEDISMHSRDLYGNNGTPGVKTRLDRLVQTDKLKSIVISALFLMIIGIAGRIIYDSLKG